MGTARRRRCPVGARFMRGAPATASPALVLAVWVSGACGAGERSEVPSAWGEAPDTVVSWSLPEQEVHQPLGEPRPLRRGDGAVARFGRVQDVAVSADLVFVLDGPNDLFVDVFQADTGIQVGRWGPLPDEPRISSLTAGRPGEVLAWVRTTGQVWTLTANSIRGPRRAGKADGSYPQMFFVADTLWLIQYRGFPGPESVRLPRDATAYPEDGGPGRAVRLPDIVRYDASFALLTSYGSLENFPRMHLVAWHPTYGLVEGDNQSYGFVIRHDGRTVSVEVDAAPVPLSEGERLDWAEIAREFNARASVEYRIPSVKPAFRSLTWDPFGRIWVGRYTESIPIERLDVRFPSDRPRHFEQMTYDVFDGGGTYLFTVRLPHRSRIVEHLADGLVLARRVLSLGNQEVVEIYPWAPSSS